MRLDRLSRLVGVGAIVELPQIGSLDLLSIAGKGPRDSTPMPETERYREWPLQSIVVRTSHCYALDDSETQCFRNSAAGMHCVHAAGERAMPNAGARQFLSTPGRQFQCISKRSPLKCRDSVCSSRTSPAKIAGPDHRPTSRAHVPSCTSPATESNLRRCDNGVFRLSRSAI